MLELGEHRRDVRSAIANGGRFAQDAEMEGFEPVTLRVHELAKQSVAFGLRQRWGAGARSRLSSRLSAKSANWIARCLATASLLLSKLTAIG